MNYNTNDFKEFKSQLQTEDENVYGNTEVETYSNIEKMCDDGGNTPNNKVSMGYSGTSYKYSESGSTVTLNYGMRAKNGISTTYSNLFRYQLIGMNSIYSSFNETQKAAWMVIRSKSLAGTIGGVDWDNPKEVLIFAAETILDAAGIDIGTQLEATVLGMKNWYNAEQNAIKYFNMF